MYILRRLMLTVQVVVIVSESGRGHIHSADLLMAKILQPSASVGLLQMDWLDSVV